MTTKRQRVESTHSCLSEKSKYLSLIQLRKDIGVIEGVSIIIGIIIGSGIFVSPAGVLIYTNGSSGLSLLVWLVTGLFSLMGALVWAELGSMIPRSGGEFIYILKIFGKLPGFITLWMTLGCVGPMATAANSMIFAEYVLQPFFIGCKAPYLAIMIVAIFGVLTLSAVNCHNASWATKVATVFTICKVGALVTIIIIGFYHLVMGTTDSFSEPFSNTQNVNIGSLSMAFYQGFWAYSGWNYLNFLTNEMKNPERNLPLAIVISLVLVTLVYILANIAYLAVMTPAEMLMYSEKSIAIAVLFANRSMGPVAWLMPIFVGISVFGSMNAEILSLSRLTHSGAEENQLPQILSMVSYRHLTPTPSIILIAMFTIFFQFYKEASYLIDLMGFVFTIKAALCVISLLYLRYKFPDLNRPLKIPILVPIIFLVCDIFVAGLSIYQKPFDTIMTIVLILLSIPIYFIFIAWKEKPKNFENLLLQSTLYLQKFLLVVPQDTDYGHLDKMFQKDSKKGNGVVKEREKNDSLQSL